MGIGNRTPALRLSVWGENLPSESSSSWPEAHLPVRQLNTAGEFCAKLCQSAAAIAQDKLVGRTGTGRERGRGGGAASVRVGSGSVVAVAVISRVGATKQVQHTRAELTTTRTTSSRPSRGSISCPAVPGRVGPADALLHCSRWDTLELSLAALVRGCSSGS